eukprot:CAMPEP_0181318164 /NCGR_PEP_ID=MMETSP1101-20121128/16859_1 /TAXON_ID=46948 /ORGANISM="Rhodomonas abbreviata, Strain Caron Lab Isolate" /LENGTH=362 /DNA_ID=CAMNT_0023425613 /DNA_START=264 /DNA_END=1352 /DNA_ORIENTATION=-
MVCWCLRAADASLSVQLRPTALPGPATQVENEDQDEIDLTSTQGEQATFVKSLPFPFEVVHNTWENGPPDQNLLWEDLEVRHVGTEEIKKKFIHTKNPLPFILRKTVFRLEEFVFEEEQSIDLRQRYSKAWSENRCFEGLVKARRTFHLKEDPNNKGWSVLEQTLSVSASSVLGNTVKHQLEKIALSMFLNTCRTSSGKLHDAVAENYAKLMESSLTDSAESSLTDSTESSVSVLDFSSDPVEDLPKSHPTQLHGLRKMAEVVVSRGIILAGAALRVWAILKSSHQSHQTQKELAAAGACGEQELAKLRGKVDSFKQQEQLQLQQPKQQQLQQHNDEQPRMQILRNPIKRMMSVAAAAFVSV